MRLENRIGDVSDATRAVLERQSGYDLGRMNWAFVDTSEGKERSADYLRGLITTSPSAHSV
jgi:predicted kinase